MMTATIDPTIHVLRRLLELEEGWATIAELANQLEPDDSAQRSAVRVALRDASRVRAIDRMHVRHRGEPLAIFNVVHGRIDTYLRDTDMAAFHNNNEH